MYKLLLDFIFLFFSLFLMSCPRLHIKVVAGTNSNTQCKKKEKKKNKKPRHAQVKKEFLISYFPTMTLQLICFFFATIETHAALQASKSMGCVRMAALLKFLRMSGSSGGMLICSAQNSLSGSGMAEILKLQYVIQEVT